MRYVQQRVYLLRHGETAWRLGGRHTGIADIALTERYGKYEGAAPQLDTRTEP